MTLWRWVVWKLRNCLSSFPLLRHDSNVSCKPVGISDSWIMAIRNSIGDDWKRVFVNPQCWLNHQPDSPYRRPTGNLKPCTSTALELMHIVALWWSCYFTVIMLHGRVTKRERDNVFGPTDLSPWMLEEFILWDFFSQPNLCSRLNNSSAFQCLWVLFVWMVRDSVDRVFFFF